MKCITTPVFLLIFFISTGQTKNLSTLPLYDCALKKVMNITAKQTVIVSADGSKGLESIIHDYCSVLGSNCIIKHEFELSADDFSKPLFIIGELKAFKEWSKFNLPVKIVRDGFEINNRKFVDLSDGMAFIDTNRIVVGGNSVQGVKDAQLALSGGYDITITEKGKITFIGNIKNKQFDWYNLQKLKSVNYNQIKSNFFSGIYVSKTYKEKVSFSETEGLLKSYIQQFLSIYKIPVPDKKISWFLHSNMQEYGTMSGMFGLACPGNNSAGFSIRGEIHTKGYDIGLVKHEYSHFLFDNTIPQDNNPAFFVEGSVEYVTNLNDSSLYRKRLAIAKQFKDTLNYQDLIVNNREFYGKFSEVNYSVCGVFVKYVVDRFNAEAFKRYCLAGNKNASAKELFKLDFLALVAGYKAWLDSQ